MLYERPGTPPDHDFCRHHIGSPGQPSSSYEACFNIFIRRRWSGEARSGKCAYVLGLGYMQKAQAGAYCEVKQSVPVGPKPRR